MVRETTTVAAQTESDTSEFEYRRRRYQCGDFCSFNIFKIPGLLLRNIIFPREQWDEYPDGFDRIADKFVFQPEGGHHDIPTPESMNVVCTYENVTIVTKDKVKLHAYLIKSGAYLSEEEKEKREMERKAEEEQEGKEEKLDQNKNPVDPNKQTPSPPASAQVPTLVYFHGNAGNIGYCLDIVKTFKTNPYLDKCNWLMVEYRGYGKSEGEQCEKGLYTDAKAAFHFIESRDDLNENMIVLYGHSLGGAVAIHLASRRRYRKKVAGVILENTFTSIPFLAKKLMEMAIIKILPKCCYSAKFESISKISKVKCPVLFVCGSYDDIVPNSMSEALFKKCGSPVKSLETFHGGEHNDTYKCAGYLTKVETFMKTNMFAGKKLPPADNKYVHENLKVPPPSRTSETSTGATATEE